MDHRVAAGRLRARVAGAGRPIVLLHSLLANAASWDGLVPLLSGAAQVIVFDLPGFAGVPPIIGGLTPVAAALSEAIAALHLADVPLVIGNGYGSFLALRLALDCPAVVGRLALLGCGAKFSEPGRAAFRAMREAAAVRGLEAIADSAMARLFGAAFRAAHPELMQARRDAFLLTDPAMFAAACRALETLDLEAEVQALKLPTQILVGSEDEATPIAMAQDLARRLPHATFTALEGLAHVPQLQDPARVLAAISGLPDPA